MEQDTTQDRTESQEGDDYYSSDESSSDDDVDKSQELLFDMNPVLKEVMEEDGDTEEPASDEKFSYPSLVGPSELKESIFTNENVVKPTESAADVARKIVELSIGRLKNFDIYNAQTQADDHSDSPMHDEEDKVMVEDEIMEDNDDHKSSVHENPPSPPKMHRSKLQLQRPFVSARELAEQEGDLQEPSSTPKTCNRKKRKNDDTDDEEDEVDFGGTADNDYESSDDKGSNKEGGEEESSDIVEGGNEDDGFLADEQEILDFSLLNPTMSKEEEESFKFKVMKSKSHCNKNKKYRRELIYSFCTGKFFTTDFLWFWHQNLKDDELAIQMGQILRKTLTQQERACENGGDHKKLFGLIKILYRSDLWVQRSLVDPDVPRFRRRSKPSPITKLREYVDALKKSVNKLRRATVKVTKIRKISTHLPGGRRGRECPQAKFAREHPNWPTMTFDLDGKGCPHCGHFQLVHVQSEQGVYEKNRQNEAEYQESLALFESYPKSQQSKATKPKRAKPIDIDVMCMCCVTKCYNKMTGKGCPRCEQYANEYGSVDDWDIVEGRCKCHHCICPCSLFFKREKPET